MNEPWQEMLSEQQRKILNAAEVRELLDYEPETGRLIWKRHMTPRARAGTEAGVIQNGRYRRIGILGKYYMAHRLAWLIVTGDWPEFELDHRNGKCADNRWSNLRAATSVQNNRNTIHRNAAGIIGASFQKRTGRYRAIITLDGEKTYLGSFKTAEEAGEAYRKASLEFHGEFSPCLR